MFSNNPFYEEPPCYFVLQSTSYKELNFVFHLLFFQIPLPFPTNHSII